MKTVLLGLCVLGVFLPVGASELRAADPYERERGFLVQEYVQKEGITNERVLASMRDTPRHLFVPRELWSLAYTDQALPIGHEQTISPPFIVAYMTEMLDPQPTDKVLEIGTGSGYQAAILAPLVKEVYTIEIVEPLGKRAAATLKRQQYRNVFPKIGDGFQGWPDKAPFDKIIVTCSPESIPLPLIEQLKEGGKMIIPLGERYQQVFYLLEKKEGKLVSRQLQPTLFVPMTGQSEQQRRVKPDPSRPRLVNGSFELDENQDGFIDGFHYQRRLEWMEGNAPHGNRYVQFSSDQPGQIAHMLQGFAIDGRNVKKLRISLDAWLHQFEPGSEPHQKPGLVIHYYDERRKPLASNRVGDWTVGNQWERLDHTVNVPSEAREAIVQIGLNGATGKVSVDDVAVTPVN
ncbi:MAG: protein-L-isoaspartate(D-aspartate) O-methyltransferase [Planctomycetaceae bacterium]|nr:protein-L-isoaspartate(D-aspartate) O-methyltransferase [Planctomycetaceae bacterium]